MSERMDAGTIVDGRYRVQERLGSGGMADVYCAEDLQLGRRVALKLLYRRFAEDQEFVERFRREASSAAGLQHPNVVSVYDRGEYDETSYIAMEYIDGRTLKQIVERDGPLEAGRAVDLTTQVLRAARFAHKRGVIHRDLKPHNVIVDAEGRAKVTDFGIARAGASDMTETGSIMGTAQYLSPEQAQGLPVSAASDLYSVGIVLYELLTGRVPFDGESAVAIALQQVSAAPVGPSQLNPAVSPALEQVVLRALEKDPARRFADADEFIRALEQARAGVGADSTAATVLAAGGAGVAVGAAAVGAAPVTQVFGVGAPAPATGEYAQYHPVAPLPPEPPRERSRWWVGLLAALVVAGLIIGGLLYFGGSKVTVPSVVGTDQADGEVVLKNKGFSTESVLKTSTQRQGTVIGQNPEPGSRVGKGDTVTLTISAGPGEAGVPDVAGAGRRAARKQLTKAGFDVRERVQNDDKVAKDHVIETLPPGGQRLEKGQVVTLVISAGRERLAVPSVIGQSQADARSALEDAGFVVSASDQESADKKPGTVLAQNPAAGTPLATGQTVTLTVAAEPAATAVPDVTGQAQTDAGSTLIDAGFRVVTRKKATTDPAEDGTVLRQNPSAGRKIKKGSKVTITVGELAPSTPPQTTPTTTPTPPPTSTAP